MLNASNSTAAIPKCQHKQRYRIVFQPGTHDTPHHANRVERWLRNQLQAKWFIKVIFSLPA